MSTELKLRAEQAAEAIDWLLNIIHRDAPQLSGKAMGNAEKCASALRAALAQRTVTGEPVGFTYMAEIEYAHTTGGNGSFWRFPPDNDDEAVPLCTHPAQNVPDDAVRDAERWRYAIADSGNQTMNFIDIFDDWDGDGSFVEAFDKARLADKKEGSAA